MRNYLLMIIIGLVNYKSALSPYSYLLRRASYYALLRPYNSLIYAHKHNTNNKLTIVFKCTR